MPTLLEGRLVRLRAREVEDTPVVHRWMNDPEVTQQIMVRYPSSSAVQQEHAEDAPDANFAGARFAIETLGGKLIGYCALRTMSPEDRCAALSMVLREREYLAGGYDAEALRMLCRFGFAQMNLHRIEVDVYEDNGAAIASYVDAGFRHEVRRRQADYRYGAYRDVLIMGLLSRDFIERPEEA